MITAKHVEAREYSYVSAVYYGPLRFERFLVPSPRKAEALAQATAYATARWGEPADINVYPRNYVAKARRLLAEGRTA